MRLRALLLLGYAAVIGILLVSGAVITASARTGMKTTIERDAEALAAALMDEIQLALRERVQMLQAFVGVSPDLHRVVEESNTAYAAKGSADAIEADIDADDAAWCAAKGKPPTPAMMRILTGEASEILRRTMDFHERQRGTQVFAEIFVTNRYGANVGQTGRTSDFKQDDEEWWDVAWHNGAWISAEVGLDASAGVHSLDIGVRVENAETQPIGVLKAVMNVNVVREIIEEFGERSRLEGAVIELLDAGGSLIHRQGEPEAFGQDLSDEEAVRALLVGGEGAVVETTSRGETLRAYVGARGSRNCTTPGWSLILNQPTDRAYGPLNDMTRRSLLVGILGASLALIVGWSISVVFGRMAQRLEGTSEALRGSEAHVRSIVTSAVDGIVTADTVGRIETFNPAAERIFGRTAADVIGRNLTLLMPEPFASEHDVFLRRYRETGQQRVLGTQFEVRGLRADGTEFPLDLALGEIEEAGRHRYVGILRDASGRHEARRALEDAKEAAEGASQSKSRFLANMSHDLRTPLNAIIGYAEMVAEELEERAEPALVADLGKIRTAGMSLLGLIDEILDLSKIEAGRVETFAEPFDLNDAMTEIEATVLPLMRNNDNTFELDAPPGLGTVHSDCTKLRQILLNLLSNASKFTQAGRIELRVRREAAEPHDWMEFRVRDDGIGMTPEQLETIWDAFAQAEASTTRRYGGTGLGLTITRRFTELLGGSVAVISQPGKGTTFTVRLPAPEPPPAETTV